MKKSLLALGILAPLALAACVTAPQLPPSSTRIAVVEAQKKDIAINRNRGMISYEEAARRQFAIEQASYALRPSEIRFWNEAIATARMADEGRISKQEYQRRIQIAYARDVGA
ncbi:hypothetical protein [Methylobrevis pamukkalensis]|uniref:Lipoprotein n=1 Tax=Methylobrevis pamukkalensis TaxID=1439726 RepID=A0A1E3H424_9HYPH|nr:hypothetical protein [Methylobrevis pamukkalensis]ODN70536.1 hypothetical protein A6302_02138 [Methylobrevis pamukkalensis]